MDLLEPEARQMVSHKAILVNNKLVNVPSFQVQPGDEIKIKENKQNQLRIQNAMELSSQRESCD